MKILIIAPNFPMPDRASGDLRFYNILQMLTKKHQVFYYGVEWKKQAKQLGKNETQSYREGLENLGIVIVNNLWQTLLRKKYDAIFFEFYHPAKIFLSCARYWQPQAKTIIDSVDVHFQRLLAKAKLKGKQIYFSQTAKVKKEELATYKKADIVIAVTQKDKKILLEENKELCVEIIPNIHEPKGFQNADARTPGSLLFIGGFSHLPNKDAMLYFCRDVFPLIKKELPDARLTIVGSTPPKSISELSQDHIEVTGYVPDVKPYLESAYISVAPLRYGAGMKGKISEALSFGLPVVTTEVGIEGFGLTPGKNVLVGNNAQKFADAVIDLCRDKTLYNKISKGGWQFMQDHYSKSSIENQLHRIFDNLTEYKLKKMPRALALTDGFIEIINYQLHKTARCIKRCIFTIFVDKISG